MEKTGFSEITEARLNYQGKDPWYCEIAITGKCNFNCTYCNRFNSDIDVEKLSEFLSTVTKLKHIQITGGEPTVHPDFMSIMQMCRAKTDKLGLSTNGTFSLDKYRSCGADMFSISLDDYDFDILKKRGYRKIDQVVSNIVELSKTHYVNIGLVVDALNRDRIGKIIDYILSLGVDDIKLSTSTHDDQIPEFTEDYSSYPILSYRVKRFRQEKQMRGFPAKYCGITKNDVTIVGGDHYPCLVYFREGGKAIGKVSANIMEERRIWGSTHICDTDPICSKYCMDFKCEFNRALENKEVI